MSSRRHHAKFIKKYDGFTLVELLVVVAMTGLMMAATAGLFRSNSIAYTVGEQVTSLEQNTRVGMDFLGFTIRAATQNLDPSIFLMDNDSNNNSADVESWSQTYRTLLNVKEGTDILEVYTSLCPEPMYIYFNSKAASMPQLPTATVSSCLDCDMANMSVPEIVSECLADIEAIIQSEETDYSCAQEPTSSSNGGGAKVTITNNRGSSSTNAPGDCIDPDNANNTWLARIDFGYHYILFIYDDPAEPDNPKLMRYRITGPEPGETLANYVYDMQIQGGRDTVDDDETLVDTWADGAVDGSGDNDSSNVLLLRISLLARTKGEDRTRTDKAVTILENSGITDAADARRERTLIRTVRIRNKTF